MASGRERAFNSPFWATAIGRMNPNVQNIVRQTQAMINRSPMLEPYCWMGSGWRTGSVEHSSGRSIDIMITSNTGQTPTPTELKAGNALVSFFVENATKLGVQGIIFSRDSKRRPQFWGYSKGRYWRNGAPRGSVSGDHVDHLHVMFRSNAKWNPRFDKTIIGAITPPPPKIPEGILDMSKFDFQAYSKNQKIQPGKSYLRAHSKGSWWLFSNPGLVMISVNGYALAGNDCQLFITAENDKNKTARLIGRVPLPNGRGSFSGSASTVLRDGEVVRYQAINNSGKAIEINNISSAIVYED